MKTNLIMALFCVLFIHITCFSDSQEKIIRNKYEQFLPNENQKVETNYLKECAMKMDLCLKGCNEKNPYSYLENSNRENCRDRCIDKILNTDGCYMYYRSSRNHVFRAYTTR